jgi:hypothetical protein
MDSRAGTHSTRTTRSIEVSLSPGFPGGGPHTHTKHFFFFSFLWFSSINLYEARLALFLAVASFFLLFYFFYLKKYIRRLRQ